MKPLPRVEVAPVLATLIRGVPRTLRSFDAPDGAHVIIRISGAAGGAWSFVRDGDAWRLAQPLEAKADAAVELDGDTAWRVFTKNISPAEAGKRVSISGDEELGARVLHTVSIVA